MATEALGINQPIILTTQRLRLRLLVILAMTEALGVDQPTPLLRQPTPLLTQPTPLLTQPTPLLTQRLHLLLLVALTAREVLGINQSTPLLTQRLRLRLLLVLMAREALAVEQSTPLPTQQLRLLVVLAATKLKKMRVILPPMQRLQLILPLAVLLRPRDLNQEPDQCPSR
jgi:hypothetical protein